MNTDLEQLSLEELKQLQKDVASAIDGFKARRLAEARAVLEEKARELGVTIDEVFSDKKGKAKIKSGKVAPKYVDPADPTVTWSGRGPKPKWVRAYLAEGRSLDDLKI